MHFFRRLIALLLIATLPAYGWAALGLPQACPMQAAPVVQASDAGHDCCAAAKAADDASQPDQSGSPCKPGQQCKTGSLHHPQQPPAAQAAVVPGQLAAASHTPVLSSDPTGIWRPPRSL